MQPEVTSRYRAARHAYEWGRLRFSTRRALPLVLAIGTVAYVVTGPRSLVWLPVTLSVWMLAYWRGGPLLRGSWFGLGAGAVTYALPMTILRPCCAPEKMLAAGADCCTMPEACLGAGAVVGFVLAAFVPTGASRWRTVAGMGLGVASVAILRCSTLFFGESVGLLGGVLAGLAAASLARGLLARAAPR